MDKVQFPKFGTRITFNAVLYRRFLDGQEKKAWVKENVNGEFSKPTIQNGIVIGYRWLRNGRIQWGSYDEPTIFTAIGEPIPAVLVAYHPRRKPVLVPMDGIQ